MPEIEWQDLSAVMEEECVGFPANVEKLSELMKPAEIFLLKCARANCDERIEFEINQVLKDMANAVVGLTEADKILNQSVKAWKDQEDVREERRVQADREDRAKLAIVKEELVVATNRLTNLKLEYAVQEGDYRAKGVELKARVKKLKAKKNDCKSKKKQCRTKENEFKIKQREVETTQRNLEATQKELEAKQRELETKQKQCNAKEEKRQARQKQCVAFKEECEGLTTQRDLIQREIDKLSLEARFLRETDREGEIARQEQELTNRRLQLEQREKVTSQEESKILGALIALLRIEAATPDAAILALRTAIHAAERSFKSQSRELRDTNEKALAEKSQMQSEIARLLQENEDIERRLHESREENVRAQGEITDAKNKMSQSLNNQTRLQTAIEELEHDKNELDEKLKEKGEDAARLQTTIDGMQQEKLERDEEVRDQLDKQRQEWQREKVLMQEEIDGLKEDLPRCETKLEAAEELLSYCVCQKTRDNSI